MLNKLIEKMPDELGELARLHDECANERLVFSHYCILALPDGDVKALHQRYVDDDKPTAADWRAAAKWRAEAADALVEAGSTWEQQEKYLIEAFKNAVEQQDQ